MNLYSIYIDNKNEDASPTIIRQGFSIWAIIFNVFWAMYHKMWIIMAFFILLNLISFHLETLLTLEKTAQFFIFAFLSTELREWYSSWKGLMLDDVILANSEEEAEIKYMMRKGDKFYV